jgi:hypothetical protein
MKWWFIAEAPPPKHLGLRAARLQLAPDAAAWDRTPEQGVVSHRSAAALYGLGHLPADRHDGGSRGLPAWWLMPSGLGHEDLALIADAVARGAGRLGDGLAVLAGSPTWSVITRRGAEARFPW